MKRRKLITLLGSAAVAWPLAARAQQPGRTYRLGFFLPVARDAPAIIAFFGELRVQIGKVFHINQIVEAHRLMEENKAGGKIVVLT